MTLQHVIGSFKIYGIKGCLDFLSRAIQRGMEKKKWNQYVIPDDRHIPKQGITIIGNLAGAGSLCKVLRDFCINLKRANIPYQAYSRGCDHPIPESEYNYLVTPTNQFKLNRYSAIIGMANLPPLPKTGCRHYSIYYWEFESGLLGAYPELADPTNVIVNSDFNLSAFRKQLPQTTHVYKILYPFQFSAKNVTDSDKIRAKFGISQSDYMVFYNFDYASGYYRKNPEGAVFAFASAFKEIPNAKLVFKTQSSSNCPKYVESLKRTVQNMSVGDKVVFINSFIPQDDLVSLTASCNVYLSLHKGEGFGLGIAEAMFLGKPVVVTDYSAPKEFCNKKNAILIPCKMTNLKESERDIWQYKHVQQWAEPDLDAAASALINLYNNPEFAKEIGNEAKKQIKEYFSIEKFRASVEAFLKDTES